MTRHPLLVSLPLTALACLALSGCGAPSSNEGASKENGGATPEVDFVIDVKPILQSQCVRCHHDQAIMGGLNLMNRELAMRGSSRGPVIVPGEPEKSSLYRVTLLPEDQDHAMPATGAKLDDRDKEILRLWIEQGAHWPEGEEGIMAPIQIDLDRV